MLSRFISHYHKEADTNVKREQLYNMKALFYYLCILILLYIANRVYYYFSSPAYKNLLVLTTAPISILGVLLFTMMFIYYKINRSSFRQEKLAKNPWSLDSIKVVIYVIIVVTIVEARLQDIELIEDRSLYTLFWLSSEIALLTWPTILSLETKVANLTLLLFNFIYLYVRMLGYQMEIVDSSFYFVKIAPLLVYLYKLRSSEEAKSLTKDTQKGENKLAAKVLSLMPEGIAIIEMDGLKYANDSMRTILRVKEEECLESLFALENSRLTKKKQSQKERLKKSHTSPNNSTRINKNERSTGNLRQVDSRSQFATGERLEIFEMKLKELKGKLKPDSDGEECSGRILKLSKSVTLKKKTTFDLSKFNPERSKDAMELSSVSDNQEVDVDAQRPSTDQKEEAEVEPEQEMQEEDSIYEERGPSEDDEGSSKDIKSPLSVASIADATTIQLRMKRIMSRIEKPFKESCHKTLKDAVYEILSKMEDEFGYENCAESMISVFSKNEEKSKKSHLKSRSLTFGQNAKKKQRRPSIGASHWTEVMQSVIEKTKGISQHLEIKLTPVLNNGRPGVLVLIRDVTEAEIINQMEDKERAQSRALASVAHEFRTPLNGILGMLSSLKDMITEEVGNNYLTPAYNSAKMLLMLVNDILDFHQVKEKKLMIVPIRFNLLQRIEESLSLISTQARARGLELRIESDEQVSKMIFNDPNRLQQVINNLLGNAIKFTLEGSITVRLEPYDDKRITIKVIDTGIGIEPGNIKKLFKAFGKVHSKQTQELNPQGVGLGLTISNTLAKILCSDDKISGLNVTSQPKKGSVFYFIVDNLTPEEQACELNDDEAEDSQNIAENLRVIKKGSASQPLSSFIKITTAESAHVIFSPMLKVNTTSLVRRSITTPKDNFLLIPQSPLLSSMARSRDSPLSRDALIDNHHLKSPFLKATTDASVRSTLIQSVLYTEADKRHEDINLMLKTLNTDPILTQILATIKNNIGQRPVILVVDDVEINHIVFKKFLEPYEIDIDSAYNGKEAIEKLKSREKEDGVEQYQTVFLDVEMPIMDGLECGKRIRRMIENGKIKDIPLIGQSGHTGEEEKDECKKSGMIGYLQKPIDKAKLIETLISLLQTDKIVVNVEA